MSGSATALDLDTNELAEDLTPHQLLRLRLIKRHCTAWDPSKISVALNVAMDATIVEGCSPDGARVSYSHVVVLDNFIGEAERAELFTAVTDYGWEGREEPPTQKWERQTCDGAGASPTWGLKASVLCELLGGDNRAILEVQSRLCRLYPEYNIVHLPSDVIQSGVGGVQPSDAPAGESLDEDFDCCPMLANAAVAGDEFQWHIDADPAALPPSSWTSTFGDYCNGEPGKPLLVSLILYLDKEWPRGHDAETLFLDASQDVGVVVRPKAYRAVLMDQDVLHRLSPPSRAAGRPRYSLVWKLAFLPKAEGGRCCIARREWGSPSPIGSAARLEVLKRRAASAAGTAAEAQRSEA
uniref:Prolyl 4-hydroxylase alpha subunit Fe(2+) 2OG dioxygenase domain-containing protein n=1 Tax=Tetraselmis sp. GSL018 TaxID=582737 RepID=A0A061RJK4_9CHLO